MATLFKNQDTLEYCFHLAELHYQLTMRSEKKMVKGKITDENEALSDQITSKDVW